MAVTVKDYSATEHKVIFIPDGGVARVVETVELLENPERLRFHLVPTPAYREALGNRIKNDKSYVPQDDLYVKEIPREYIQEPLVNNPNFMTWLVWCTWELNPKDMAKALVGELWVKLKSLQQQRDALSEGIHVLNHDLAKHMKYSDMISQTKADTLANSLQKFNLLNPQQPAQR